MTDFLTRVPPRHRADLRQFVLACYDMTDSGFMKRVLAQDHTVRSELLEDGRRRLSAPDYDWDDFQSFLAPFRQIAMLNDEPAYLPKIINIVRQYGSEQVRDELKKLKKDIIPAIEGRVSPIRYAKRTLVGETSFTPYELLDATINGRVFHRDQEHAEVATMLREMEPDLWRYVWPSLVVIILPVVNASVWLVNVIRAENMLGEDFPKRSDE